jgi:aromatic-L-amino-acid decarboxylase
LKEELAETGRLKELLETVGQSLDQFLKFEHLDAQHPSKDWKSVLNQPLPVEGIGVDLVTQLLTEQVIPNGSPVPNPGFSSFITTGAVTTSTLATTAANIASPQRYLGTAFNFIEELSLEWLADMLGVKGLKGVYSSGGSVANLIALGGARQSAFEKVGIDPAADGIDRKVRIYASAECHHTIQRSAGVLGLGRQSVRLIDCDSRGRMLVDSLAIAIEEDVENDYLPMAIVANAGTTNTGAIDPLAAIGRIANERNIWFHVDGAYGLPGILDSRLSALYEGLELADSVIVDPHKWLGASVGVAATFVKDRDFLLRAFTQEPADYLEGSVEQDCGEQETGDSNKQQHSLDDFGIPYFDFGVELSAPCRGIVVWAIIQEIGVEGLRQRIIRHNDMARDIAEHAKQHPKLELLDEPTLSICCFRYIDERIDDLNLFNQKLHRRLVRDNIYMPSTTKIKGQLAIRPCYVGARHEKEQAEGLVKAVLEIGERLVHELG